MTKSSKCFVSSHAADINLIRRVSLELLPESLALLGHQCWEIKRLSIIRADPIQLVDIFKALHKPSYDDAVAIWKAAESVIGDYAFLRDLYNCIKSAHSLESTVTNILITSCSYDKYMVFNCILNNITVDDLSFVVKNINCEDAIQILKCAKNKNIVSSFHFKRISWELVRLCNESVYCVFDMIDTPTEQDIENAWMNVKPETIAGLVASMERRKVLFKKIAWKYINYNTVSDFMRSLSVHTKQDKRAAVSILGGYDLVMMYSFIKTKNVGDRIRVWKNIRGRDIVFFVNIISCLKEHVSEEDRMYAFTRCHIFDITYIASKFGFSTKMHTYLAKNSDFVAFANNRISSVEERSQRLAIMIACDEHRLVDSIYRAIKQYPRMFNQFSNDEIISILYNCSLEMFQNICIKEKVQTISILESLSQNMSKHLPVSLCHAIKIELATGVYVLDQCSICMCKPKLVITTLNCGHVFDPHCITRWFKSNISCPFCRAVCTHLIISAL